MQNDWVLTKPILGFTVLAVLASVLTVVLIVLRLAGTIDWSWASVLTPLLIALPIVLLRAGWRIVPAVLFMLRVLSSAILVGLLVIAFVVLKVTDVIEWSWWWIAVPLLVSFLITILLARSGALPAE